MKRRKGLLVILALALFLGLCAALLKRSSNHPDPSVFPQVEKVMPEISQPDIRGPAKRPESDSESEVLPPLQGFSAGTGEVRVEIPESTMDIGALGKSFSDVDPGEDKGLVWPETSGKFKKIEDQVREIQEEVDEVTLDTVSRTLNLLPFVSADPEEAEWHISGGKIELEIKIPVEDIKIGPKGCSDG